MGSKDIGGFMANSPKNYQKLDEHRSSFFLYIAAGIFAVFTSILIAFAFIGKWVLEYIFESFILAVIFTLLFSFIAVCVILSFKLILHIIRNVFLNVTENP